MTLKFDVVRMDESQLKDWFDVLVKHTNYYDIVKLRNMMTEEIIKTRTELSHNPSPEEDPDV